MDVEKFLAGYGDKAVPQEKETPAESPADKQPAKDTAEPQPGEGAKDGSEKEGEKQSSEIKPEPKVFEAFHKHPRWKQLVQERDKLRSDLTKLQDEVEPLLSELKKPEEAEMPAWFREAFEGDEAKWEKYRSYEARQRETIKQELMAEVRAEQDKAQKTQKDEQVRWDKWVEDELETLEEEGLKFDKNELLKIATTYLPTDEKGNISLKKAYDILQKTKVGKPKSDEKKQVADKTMEKGKGTDDKPKVRTWEDLRNKPLDLSAYE